MAVHLGDVGTIIRVTVTEDGSAVDLSTATGIQLRFRAPDGTVTNYTASFTTNGSDGVLQYALTADDIDQVGLWEVRPYFTLGTFTGHTSAVTFTVLRVE